MVSVPVHLASRSGYLQFILILPVKRAFINARRARQYLITRQTIKEWLVNFRLNQTGRSVEVKMFWQVRYQVQQTEVSSETERVYKKEVFYSLPCILSFVGSNY